MTVVPDHVGGITTPRPSPALVACSDQLGAALSTLPPMLWSYKRQLEDAGFAPHEAVRLTCSLQGQLLGGQSEVSV